jgi:hypothetical protein
VAKRNHDAGRPRTSRRDFAKAVGLLAAGSLLAPPGHAAEAGPAGPAEGLMAVARARYGKHLRDEQLKEIEQALRHRLLVAEFLKRVPLKNSDEPVFIFRADLP